MAPVGMFDSGVGGLSVLAEFRRIAPGHPVIYIADQAWAPYGERSLAEVQDRSVSITRYLIDQGCELVVVACNSASAAALHHLRETFPGVRFVGMEPAVKPAASRSERGVIGVLATDATFQGELYASVVDQHANGTEIVEQACPGLADAVERLGVDAPETLKLVSKYVTPLRDAGIDTLVLGCTHYPFLFHAIQDVVGPEISVIDPAPAVARQTHRLLGEVHDGGTTVFLTTADSDTFAAQIDSLLQLDVVPQHIEIEPGQITVGGARVVVLVGDLTMQETDAIVNAANERLQHGGGVAAAIVSAGGAIIQDESDAWVSRHGPVRAGTGAITSAGAMAASYVIHVAGPIYTEGRDNERLLRTAVSGALDAAADVGARSVAFPAISAGIYGYPVAEATAVLADEVTNWLAGNPNMIDEIRLVGFDEATTDHFCNGLFASIGSTST